MHEKHGKAYVYYHSYNRFLSIFLMFFGGCSIFGTKNGVCIMVLDWAGPWEWIRKMGSGDTDTGDGGMI